MTATLRLVDPDPVDVFDTRPELSHIRDFARARRTGPWAVLAVTLVRASCAVEPTVTLPPLVGGRMSLNLFATLVGRSGQGKGAAEGCAADAVTFIDHNRRPIITDSHPLGSGEGIARIYRPHGTDDEEPNPVSRALFSVPEVDSLAALGARRGSTLMPELRKLYSGEAVGFANASKMSAPPVAAHSYRAGLVVGVQPLRAGTLLDDSAGGTPQRFIWAGVDDPDAPNTPPECPDPLTVKLPKWSVPDTVDVPAIARHEIDAHRLATLRGEAVDPLDGHALLCRLKVASALMALAGRGRINDEDWELAGQIMDHSAAVRTSVIDTMRAQKRIETQARGIAEGERQSVTEEIVDRKRTDRAREGIRRRLINGPMPRSELRRALAAEIRPTFDVAVLDLVASGVIVETETPRGTEYSLR